MIRERHAHGQATAHSRNIFRDVVMLSFSECDSIRPLIPNHARETLACLSAPQPNVATECATAAEPFSKGTFSRRFSATFHLEKTNPSRHAQPAQLSCAARALLGHVECSSISISVEPCQRQFQMIMVVAVVMVMMVMRAASAHLSFL
jgi:hypothetical protein